MAYQFATYEKRARIAYVTLNRPEVLNALHPPAQHELSEIWDDFQADEECWVAILTGAGERAFSAGNDLKWIAAHAQETPPGEGEDVVSPVRGGFGGLTSRLDLFKPVIAAVNGYALGGGLEMALACDLIVAAEHARLGLPEPRVGLIAGAGGVHRLPRQLPLKIAMGLILTGTPMTAQEAHQRGLVNEVVPLAELMPTAERWAQQILECAPLSVRASKEASYQGLGHPLALSLEEEYPGVLLFQASEDRIEGPRAFTEKRQPQWKGR